MKHFLVNLLLVVAGITVALAAAEIVLRYYNPFAFRMRGDQIVLPQNFKYEITNTKIAGIPDNVTHTKNTLGFRGPPFPPDPDRHLSIIAIGGSTTESFYQSDGMDWPSLLAHDLSANFRDLWLNNAGLDGHSTIGHIHLMRQFVSSLKPRVAIFLIGVNDVGIADSKPDDARLIPGVKFDTPGEFIKSIAGFSEVAALTLNLYRYFHTVKIGMAHGNGFLVTRSPGAMSYRPTTVNDAERRRMVLAHEQFRGKFRDRLESLIIETKEAGILPILVTQPSLVGNGVDPRTGIDLERLTLDTWRWGGEIDGATGWAILESYNDVTRGIAARTQTPLIDLAKIMPKSTLFFYDFIHYTNLGAEHVSRVIYTEVCPILERRFPQFLIQHCGP
jgi:lysophospholipase L1-like esterase